MEILVVDDDPSILHLLGEILTRTGYHTVTSVSSAKGAIEAVASTSSPFDCFLVDIQMPETDGIALVKMIRQTPGYRTTPVIMLTAMSEKSYLDDAFAVGATDYLTKPFDYQDLRERITEAKRLAHEKSSLDDRPFTEGEFKEAGPELKAIRISDPVSVSGVDGALDYIEFDNYLAQMARNRDFDATLQAAKILNVDRHYRQDSARDFLERIHAAALSVSRALVSEGGFLSYRGDGTFICVNDAGRTVSMARSESDLAESLQRTSGDLKLSDFKMVLGEPVAVKSGTAEDTLEKVSLAINAVEQRYHEKKETELVIPRFLLRMKMSSDQRRLERKTYERLLKAVRPGVEDGPWRLKLAQREAASRPK